MVYDISKFATSTDVTSTDVTSTGATTSTGAISNDATSTGATSTGATSTGATSTRASVLLVMCYKHQILETQCLWYHCKVYSANCSCYGISDIMAQLFACFAQKLAPA